MDGKIIGYKLKNCSILLRPEALAVGGICGRSTATIPVEVIGSGGENRNPP